MGSQQLARVMALKVLLLRQIAVSDTAAYRYILEGKRENTHFTLKVK